MAFANIALEKHELIGTLTLNRPEKLNAMSPPLMAKDHVHFTVDGYKKSAGEFLNTLIPIIRELRSRSNVVSNH